MSISLTPPCHKEVYNVPKGGMSEKEKKSVGNKIIFLFYTYFKICELVCLVKTVGRSNNN